MTRRRRFWGWGWEDEGPDPTRLALAEAGLAASFAQPLQRIEPPRLDEIALAPPRLRPPASLAHVFSDAPFDRAGHTYGKAYRDVVRALRRDFAPAPDLVAFPSSEGEVEAVLAWCAEARAAAIPYGGGSSVCGGVEARGLSGFAGAVSIDLTRLDRVLEIDPTSRAARIQAGALGPVLEDQLRPAGLTLRHFPQSFEFSTLGGWLATRSGGHFATLYTHIDELCESMRIVTPTGTIETRRLPASGAGPSPDRFFLGSEGALGIITEAWMRVQSRPGFRAGATATFADFPDAARAVRLIAQSGLNPANCRLLDPMEALLNGVAAGGPRAVLIIGFESADHPLDASIARAVEICRSMGGDVAERSIRISGPDSSGNANKGDAADAWRNAFLRAPYLRDALAVRGVVIETFETAITWDRFDAFVAAVREAAARAATEICGAGLVTCRLTHVYPDGAAPYFTVIAPGRPDAALQQWDAIKCAASEAILAAGGTITHHHAVGRDHRPWYDRERPSAFARVLAAAKRELDPAGVLNPGVLIDSV